MDGSKTFFDYYIGYAEKNKWFDIKMYIESSTNSDGYIKVWLNGNLVAEHTGKNLRSKNNDGYVKLGMYTEIHD